LDGKDVTEQKLKDSEVCQRELCLRFKNDPAEIYSEGKQKNSH
jgi:hypothetical protein